MHPSQLEQGLFALPLSGEPLRFRVRAGPRVARVRLRHAPDGEEELIDLERTSFGFATDKARVQPGSHYRYLIDLSDGQRLALNASGLHAHEPLDRFDFSLRSSGPDWTRDAIVYQVFPDRFAVGDPNLAVRDGEYVLRGHRSRKLPFEAPPLSYREARCLDFRGGDLIGVRERLDHLNALGANALYLTPIHPAFTNHRYDVTDYEAIDPHLGGEAALTALTTEMRRRGMHLVLDAVINHLGSGHRWFNREGRYAEPGAYQDERSPYSSFFFFRKHPTHYASWKGIDTLPRLDFRAKQLRELLWGERGALRKWLRPPFQVDGYRFDCANMVGRVGEVQLAEEVWRELADALRPEGNPYLVGEHWFDPHGIVGDGLLHGGIDYLGFTFPVRRFFTGVDRDGAKAPLGGHALLRQMLETHGSAQGAQQLVCVNSHDVSRLQSSASARAFEAATALQLFWPGTPCIYYGDEIGLEGGDDPDNRRSMVWERSRWDERRFESMRSAIARRQSSPALKSGVLAGLGSGDDWIAVARVHESEIAIAVIARSACDIELDLGALTGSHFRTRFDGPGAHIELVRNNA
jgi:alpha-glucosidase